MTMTQQGLLFCSRWLTDHRDMNEKMKGVRRVQTNAALLHSALEGKNVFGSMDGYVLDHSTNNEGHVVLTIYVPKMKAVGHAMSANLVDLYQKVSVSLHLFVDEHSLKRKVRFNLL